MEARNSGLGTHKRDFRIGGMAAPPSQPLRQSLFVVLKNRLRRHPLSCRLKKLSPLLCARPGEDDRQVAIPPLTGNGLDLTWSRLRTQVASFSVVSVADGGALATTICASGVAARGGYLCGRIDLILDRLPVPDRPLAHHTIFNQCSGPAIFASNGAYMSAVGVVVDSFMHFFGR
jgi:hypothetical protein